MLNFEKTLVPGKKNVLGVTTGVQHGVVILYDGFSVTAFFIFLSLFYFFPFNSRFFFFFFLLRLFVAVSITSKYIIY